MSLALLVDFGSTYTKLRAVSVEDARVIGTAQAPSTVGSDVTVGLQAGLALLQQRVGRVERWRWRLATSSASTPERVLMTRWFRDWSNVSRAARSWSRS